MCVKGEEGEADSENVETKEGRPSKRGGRKKTFGPPFPLFPQDKRREKRVLAACTSRGKESRGQGGEGR